MNIFNKIKNKRIDREMNEFYLGGGRRKTIEKHFNGIEYSVVGFNEKVLELWRKDRQEKRNTIVFSVILPIIISLVTGAAVAVWFV